MDDEFEVPIIITEQAVSGWEIVAAFGPWVLAITTFLTVIWTLGYYEWKRRKQKEPRLALVPCVIDDYLGGQGMVGVPRDLLFKMKNIGGSPAQIVDQKIWIGDDSDPCVELNSPFCLLPEETALGGCYLQDDFEVFNEQTGACKVVKNPDIERLLAKNNPEPVRWEVTFYNSQTGEKKTVSGSDVYCHKSSSSRHYSGEDHIQDKRKRELMDLSRKWLKQEIDEDLP